MRQRIGRVLSLAVPIIGAMISQNLVNLVDTAMVGQLGAASLAAVGMASMVNWLAAAFFNGLGAGVQVISARRVGERNPAGAVAALHGALVIALALVLPVSWLLATRAEHLFSLLSTDPAVTAAGVPYLRIRLLAAVFVVSNFAFRGYWNGMGRSGIYLKTIVMIHVINVGLNYLLIYGKLGFPALGVAGAGLASAIAVACGSAIHVVLAYRHAREYGFLRRGTLSLGIFANLARLSAPTGVQMVFLAGGFVAFFRIAELLGTRELAVTNVLVNLSLVCVLPAIAYGLAATTLVGQALGAGDAKMAVRWGWTTVAVGVASMLVLGGALVAAPGLWLGLLINDPETVALGIAPLVVLGLAQPIDGVGTVLSQTLIGAGAVRSVMVASVVLQWCIFLPSAYFFGVRGGGGLVVIWGAMAAYRALFSAIMVRLFLSGKWEKIQV